MRFLLDSDVVIGWLKRDEARIVERLVEHRFEFARVDGLKLEEWTAA